jgi:DHA3 family macrolide efflux protein-like MFS transporter
LNSVEHYDPPTNGFRTFIIVWATQSISLVGNGITFFATIIWLTQVQYPDPDQKAQLGLAISLVSLAAVIPIVFGAPLAGAWADRHDRKRTMIAMNLASGIVSLLVGTLMFTHTLQLWMLVAITVVDSIFGSFHAASFDTSYAMLVPDAKLPRANGMMQTIFPLSSVLAPSLAAGIISLPSLARQGAISGQLGDWLRAFSDGTSLALTVDAITFFLMGLVLIFLHVPSPQRSDLYHSSGKRKSIWEDVREGATYILHRRSMLWLLGTFAVANFASSGMGVFTPLVVKFNLAPDWSARGFTFETALALLGAAAGVGELLGGIFISVWGGLKKGRVYGVLVPMILEGFAQVAFGLSSLIYLTAVAQFVRLATFPIMGAHSQAIWQSQTPRALQGRVFSVRRLIAQFTQPLSTLVAGITGGVFNPGIVMAVLGGILILFCLAQLFNPYLLRIEEASASSARAVAT